MKLKMAQPPNKEQVKQFLEARLPQYKYSFRAGRLVNVAKTGFIGAVVLPKKDCLIINGNFPSTGATMLWVLLVFGTGVLPALLLWLMFWKGGQDKVRDEIVAAFKAQMAQQGQAAA